MADEKDSGFKITDRRKFNADGTPREEPEPEPPASRDEVKPQATASNVVSFPGEGTRKDEPGASTRSAPPREISSEATAEAAAQAAAATKAERAYSQARGPASPHLPEASFLGLANMLGIEAAMHLGYIQTHGEESPAIDLESARHVIDMLGILQAKTKGNLTSEEDHFLDGILADLRMRYVEVSRGR